MFAYGVKPGVQQCAPASEASGSKVLRGGVALRRRRLPVDRLEYSHAGVPVAQGYAEPIAYNEANVDGDPVSCSA